MNQETAGQNEEELLTYEISDDALENMARAPMDRAGNYTLYFCTQLDLCPGP
jgi:hypothetical protein